MSDKVLRALAPILLALLLSCPIVVGLAGLLRSIHSEVQSCSK